MLALANVISRKKKLNATTWKTEFVLFEWKLATGERRGSCKQNDVQIILMQLIDKKGKNDDALKAFKRCSFSENCF